jgi:hypothetical protein
VNKHGLEVCTVCGISGDESILTSTETAETEGFCEHEIFLTS